MKIKSYLAVVPILMIGFVLGCGGERRPKWIDEGAKALKDKGVLYGVGVSKKSPNPQMERDKAENRARQDLGKQIEVYVSSFMKDFMEEHADYFNPEGTSSVEFTSSVSKSVSEATLVGSQIVDHYRDEEENLWALAKISVDDVFDRIREKARQAAQERQRAILEGRANEMLEALDEEVKKKREAQNLGY
ncbi:MAG: LPP20 family lipoprotein [Deltaproteobacteria bacterium]|nr:LPP20 family lipoprotein [Deltaproteobacteria bacterium]